MKSFSNKEIKDNILMECLFVVGFDEVVKPFFLFDT